MVEAAVVDHLGEVVGLANLVEVEGVMKVARKREELGMVVEAVPKQCHHSAVFRSSCCEMVLSKMIHKLGAACRYPV